MIQTTGIEYPTGQGMDFYGFEVLGFYLKRFLLYYSDYAWNIRLLYGLIFACIVTMLILFVLFIRKIRQSRCAKKSITLLARTFMMVLSDIDFCR